MILFVTRKYPPSVGGMEKFSYELSRELGRRFPVRLVAWGGPRRGWPGLVVRATRVALALRRRGQPISGLHLGDSLLAPVGMVLGRILDAPVTATAHGLDVTYPSLAYQGIVPRALARCAVVMCDSGVARDACVQRGVPAGRCAVVACGVAPGPRRAFADADSRQEARQRAEGRFGWADPGPVLLGVGRLVRRKGMAWFINKVFPRLAERVPGVAVVVVGEGPDASRLERAVARSGARDRVYLLGRLGDRDLDLAYAAADGFVMPNVPVPGDPEGFGIAALDASVAGLWVFASRVDGIPEAVLDGVNGTLLPAATPEPWTDALAAALGDPLQLRQRGGAGRAATLDRFGWPAVADRYEAIFASVGMIR